jgi:hypothetical protein
MDEPFVAPVIPPIRTKAPSVSPNSSASSRVSSRFHERFTSPTTTRIVDELLDEVVAHRLTPREASSGENARRISSCAVFLLHVMGSSTCHQQARFRNLAYPL